MIISILTIVLIGVIVYLIRRFIPMDVIFQNIILAIGVILALVVMLKALGLWSSVVQILHS